AELEIAPHRGMQSDAVEGLPVIDEGRKETGFRAFGGSGLSLQFSVERPRIDPESGQCLLGPQLPERPGQRRNLAIGGWRLLVEVERALQQRLLRGENE